MRISDEFDFHSETKWSRTGESRTGESLTGESRTGESRTGESLTGESRTGESRPSLPQANYYYGGSSRPYAAELQVSGKVVLIRYLDETESPQIATWNLDKMQARGKWQWQYGNFPYQILEVKDKQIAARLGGSKQSSFQKLYSQVVYSTWQLRLGITALFVGCMLLFYFVVLPAIAEFGVQLLPIDQEVALGEKLAESMLGNYTKQHSRSQLANKFADRLDFGTAYPINITVVESSQVNAYALPGGQVVLFSGLLNKLESPEELAGLLGHEVGHVKQQHSLKAIARKLSGYIFLSFIVGDLGGSTSVVLENADMLYQLSYSRGLEEEADFEAMQMLEANSLDQQGFVRLLKILEEEGAKVPDELAFISSHPLTGNRIEAARQAVKYSKSSYTNPSLEAIWQQLKE